MPKEHESKVIEMIVRTLFLTSMIMVTPFALLMRVSGFRFINIVYSRIGHLITEPDCFIKEGILGLRPHFRAIACAPSNRIANRAVLRVFSAYRNQLLFLTNPLVCFVLRPLARHPVLNYAIEDYVVAYDKTAKYITINNAWGDRAPIAHLDSEIQEVGEQFLHQIGMPPGAWFVCVHSREGGYSHADEVQQHEHRNSRIEDYIQAMDEIVRRGGWVIRVGDPTMCQIPTKAQVVDYAHHPSRRGEIDLFLFAKCRFFLGNSSGPYMVSGAFGVPVALANLAPFSMTCLNGPKDIGIPKLVYSEKEQRILRFSEALSDGFGCLRTAEQFRRVGLRHIDNSSEEILELTVEMLYRLDRYQISSDDEYLQDAFHALFRPEHYTYGSKTRVGRDFLRRYRGLLE